MKLIFLDFDGVLNNDQWIADHESSWHQGYLWSADDLDPALVRLVDQLCQNTGAKIVISSTWRLVASFEELKEILYSKGLNAEIIGVTPHDPGNKKEDDIWEWLDQHRDYKQFVIFDDWESDFKDLLPHLVLTDAAIGLTQNDIAAGAQILASTLP